MPLSGDLLRLGKMNANLRKLASVPSQVAEAGAEGIEELMQEQFDNGTDAYGNQWAPLAPATLARGRTPPPLTDTEAMRSSLDVSPMSGAGISITIDDPGGIHQTGARRGTWVMPRRAILPDNTFPKAWSDVLEAAGEEAITEGMADT